MTAAVLSVAQIQEIADKIARVWITKPFVRTLTVEEYDDLYQVACLGILEAQRRWRPEGGAAIHPWCARSAWTAVSKHIRDILTERGPRRVYEKGQRATNAERRVFNRPISLDEPIEDTDGERTIGETIESPDDWERAEVRLTLHEGIRKMAPVRRLQVSLLLLLLHKGAGITQGELAPRAGLTQVAVSRNVCVAQRHLREAIVAA